ncbi:hypothetical protein FOMA001_g3542 [Fusarium oxysporum f. sp. matthiolae]|nr:hypothetical protein FOMA001_g3542 [Fusarium oxysporum f. sp. matthiolae]
MVLILAKNNNIVGGGEFSTSTPVGLEACSWGLQYPADLCMRISRWTVARPQWGND